MEQAIKVWQSEALVWEGLTPAKGHGYRTGGKRLFDLLCVLMLMPIALPLMAILAGLVMLDGHAPLFGHERIGKGGRRFRCWKLRTMVPDASARLQAHLAICPEAAREWAETFKLARDPRITPLGRFLRATSLDELPQLWNVLVGEMSIVGPRPVVAEELPLYRGALRHYQALRPGLTGLWQVSGRNALSYEARVVLDVAYARQHGIWMDLTIFAATFVTVLRRTGC